MNGGGVFVVRRPYVRRGDRFFPGTLFQDRLRRNEVEKNCPTYYPLFIRGAIARASA